MTREQCETKLMKKAQEMVAILHKYNPECKYLSAVYIGEDGKPHISINNRAWQGGEDEKKPIRCWKNGDNPMWSE